MTDNRKLLEFYRGKRVLVTGHTGFKGTWLCRILLMAGAEVYGAGLTPPTDPSLFEILGMDREMDSSICDVRDLEELKAVFDRAKPEIVIHMAAQPIVRESYRDPAYTYAVNVMGTVNMLECVRTTPGVRSVVNVTTDKVYLNREWEYAYREGDRLDGYDPYSNSKSCSELVTAAYKRSFFGGDGSPAISTCRAGNVIGGGDFAKDRIIPDCFRAALSGKTIGIRNPRDTRPFQHVLEPLFAYLAVAKAQYEDDAFAGSYNVGPDDADCVTAGRLADLFCESWGEGAAWESKAEVGAPHEANFLRLDSSRLKKMLGWKPLLTIGDAVGLSVEWTKAWRDGSDMRVCTDDMIRAYAQRWEAHFTETENRRF